MAAPDCEPVSVSRSSRAPASQPQPAFCTKPRQAVPPRLIAGALLALMAARLLLADIRPAPGPSTDSAHELAAFNMLAAVALGACLWWVAHRQAGVSGAVVALALYAVTSFPTAAAPAALGVFAMVYTGVGVSHALEGPRRKWGPRIALMAAVCAFTSAVQPQACAAGLLLALAAMLYLSPEARSGLSLFPFFAIWLGAAVAARFLLVVLFHAPIVPALILHKFEWWRSGGLLLACAAALGLWARAPRSRYFGNTAPLLAALLLYLCGWPRAQAGRWAVPFALLFVAGAFADGFEGRHRNLWLVLALLACAGQCALTFSR